MKDNSIQNINFEWTKVEMSKPVYTKFSKELHKDLKKISEKLIYNRFLLNSLSELNESFSGSKVYEQYPILAFLKQAFYYQTILETYKLYNPKEGYSIPKFIEILTNNFRRITWFPLVKIDDKLDKKQKKKQKREIKNHIKDLLESKKNELTTERAKDILARIELIRDKYLAHNDKNQKRVTVSLEELLYLQEIAEETSNELGDVLSGTSTGYAHQQKDMATSVLLRLRVFEEIRQLVLKAEGQGDENIKTSTLLEMVRFRHLANEEK